LSEIAADLRTHLAFNEDLEGSVKQPDCASARSTTSTVLSASRCRRNWRLLKNRKLARLIQTKYDNYDDLYDTNAVFRTFSGRAATGSYTPSSHSV